MSRNTLILNNPSTETQILVHSTLFFRHVTGRKKVRVKIKSFMVNDEIFLLRPSDLLFLPLLSFPSPFLHFLIFLMRVRMGN